MKELSTEEKAKAYDGNYKAYTELINRLENVKDAIKKQNYGIAMNILCKPYPEFQITTSTELKESEDEKVRKELIFYLRYQYSINENFEDIGKWIAWLEKQGVQKPANKVESNKKFTPIESALKDLICDVDNSYTIEQVRRFLFEYGYKDKILNAAQEEMQKPVWSEEDEDYINDLIKYFLQNEKLENTKEDIVIWLKSLKDRYTWKPSDEQMKALDRAQAELCSTEYNKPICDLIDALNKLKE